MSTANRHGANGLARGDDTAPEGTAPEQALQRAIDDYRATRATLEASPALMPHERAGRMLQVIRRAEEAGLDLGWGGVLPEARWELWAWTLGLGPLAPGQRRGDRFVSARATMERWPDEQARQDFFVYLARRLIDTPSPVHRARYGDLLWEWDGGYQRALQAAQGYLESVPLLAGDALPLRLQRLDALETAALLGVQIQSPTIVEAAKRAMLAELEAGAHTGFPPPLLALPTWLLALSKERIEADDLRRAKRYTDAAAAAYLNIATSERLHLVRSAYELSALLAQRLGDAAAEQTALNAIVDAQEADAAQQGERSRLFEATLLEEALRFASTHGLPERADAIRRRLRGAYRAARAELPWFDTSITLDATEIDALAEELAGQPPFTSLALFAAMSGRVPRLREERAKAAALQQRYLGLSLFHMVRVDEEGRPVARATTPKEHDEELLYQCYDAYVQVFGRLAAQVYRQLHEHGRWTADTLTDFLMTSVVYGEPRRALLRAGLDRYFVRDWTAAVYLLALQAEPVLRDWADRLGAATIRADGDTGETGDVVWLGDLLRLPELHASLGGDLTFYLRFLFTEKRGLNLRNRVAHGLLDAQDAGEVVATLVVDVLLALTTLALPERPDGGVAWIQREVNDDALPGADLLAARMDGGEPLPAAAWIRLMTDRIVRDFHPLQVILFGSYAHGKVHAESDIDLLVVVPSAADKHLLATEIRRSLANTPVAKDIIVTDPEEIERRRDNMGDVLYDALREGRVLYDRTSPTPIVAAANLVPEPFTMSVVGIITAPGLPPSPVTALAEGTVADDA